jgi:hypothetical protein
MSVAQQFAGVDGAFDRAAGCNSASTAAGWAAAGPRRRFHRADEGAHELSVHIGGNGVHVDALCREEIAGFLDAIDTGRLDIDLLEAGRAKF